MNFDLTDEQELLRSTFARFLDENSSTVRVRATPEIRMTLTAMASVWLPVCLPIAWGLWITLRRVTGLL